MWWSAYIATGLYIECIECICDVKLSSYVHSGAINNNGVGYIDKFLCMLEKYTSE